MALPKELEGKTPEEISAYYEGVIVRQKETYESALETIGDHQPPPNTPAGDSPPPRVSMNDFVKDPEGQTKKIIQQTGVTKEEFQAVTQQVRDQLIYSAKERAKATLKEEAEKAGGYFDWGRIEPLLDDVAKKCDPATLTSHNTWITMYRYNIGSLLHTIVKEQVDKARMPAESVTPGGNTPPPDVPLTMPEELVATGLGLSAESYKKGRDNMVNQKFPVTLDNRNRR